MRPDSLPRNSKEACPQCSVPDYGKFAARNESFAEPVATVSDFLTVALSSGRYTRPLRTGPASREGTTVRKSLTVATGLHPGFVVHYGVAKAGAADRALAPSLPQGSL